MSRLNARNPRSITGKSSSGDAAEIHATHFRIHLPECCGNFECLFHCFECDPNPDPGDPVPEGHGRPDRLRRQRHGEKSITKTAPVDRSERPLPKPKAAAGGAATKGATQGQRDRQRSNGRTRNGNRTTDPPTSRSTPRRRRNDDPLGARGRTAATGGTASGAPKRRPTSTNGSRPPAQRTQSARPTEATGRTPTGWRREARLDQGASPLEGEAREKGAVERGVGGSKWQVPAGGQGDRTRPPGGGRGRRRVRRPQRAQGRFVRSDQGGGAGSGPGPAGGASTEAGSAAAARPGPERRSRPGSRGRPTGASGRVVGQSTKREIQPVRPGSAGATSGSVPGWTTDGTSARTERVVRHRLEPEPPAPRVRGVAADPMVGRQDRRGNQSSGRTSEESEDNMQESLTLEQQGEAATEFVAGLAREFGLVADVGLHRARRGDRPGCRGR